jgi:hypothetical protein
MVDSNNSRRTVLVCAVLLLVTLAIYWPVHNYAFVDYDDNDYVFNNPTVKNGLTWWGFVWSFVDAHAANWHPLTWLSHMLDCQLFGLNAGGHHLVNVLFHCANCVLLFLVLRSMTGAFWRSAFAAALFAWHPLRVESVAWISERKDVLSGFFFMLTLWAYARYAQSKAEEKRGKGEKEMSATKKAFSPFLLFPLSPRRLYVLALICFTLGLLAKPMLVTLPFVLLLLDLWPLHRADTEGKSLFSISFVRANWNLLKEKLPFFALSALVCVITVFSQRTAAATNAGSILDRMKQVFVAYARYIEDFFWPHDLSVLYLRKEIPIQSAMIAALILLGIFIFVLANIRRRPYLATGWLWFVGVLVPVIGLVPVGLQSHADRYTYLPSIGLSLMLIWGGHEVFALWIAKPKVRFLLALGGIAVLSLCAMLTIRQLSYWKNTETLMEHALAIDPNNYVAHTDLGVYFSRRGETEKARAHYQRARELEPPK